MGAQGFSRHVIEVIKNNRAMLPSQNWKKSTSGKNIDGKKPIKFKKANRATKNIIYYDKKKLQKQLQFRIGLVIVISIFVLLLFLLLYNFG